MAPSSATQNSVGTAMRCRALLRAKWRHRNLNIERCAGDAQAAFAGCRRKRAAGALTLASGSPKHEAEHAVRGSSAVRRNCLDIIGGAFLIGGAESCTVGFPGDQPKAAGQLAGASGGTPVTPLTCCAQPVSRAETVVFLKRPWRWRSPERSAGAEPMRGGIGGRLQI